MFAAFGGLPTGKKNELTIFVYPVPIGKWKKLREENHEEYTKEKNRIADFYIKQVEKYLIPNLRSHIMVTDISSSATFERYSGSPTGSKF